MRKSLLGLIALGMAGVVMPALSAPPSIARDDVAVTKDGTVVRTLPPSVASVSAEEPPAKLVTIFDNLAQKYPKGIYNAISGRSITGPDNGIGFAQYWQASPFTPSAHHTLAQIQLPVTSWSGANAAIVGLYSDNGGVPGTAIKEWHVSNMATGGCCALVTVKAKGGVPLAAGTQYWVVVRPDPSKGTDQQMIWNYNVADQITSSTYAYYCKDTATASCGSPTGTWFENTYPVALAFAVRGSD